MNIADIPVLNRFVVLEGPDGAGTTTQLRAIDEVLSRAGIPHWVTCEPTDSPIGRLARQVLGGKLPVEQGTLAHLFAADRYEHLNGEDGILAHLKRGEVVICDRYIFSSLAYQGSSCGLELPLSLNLSFPLPELLVFFDLDPALSMTRLEGRKNRDIYETLPFLERVQAGYEEAIRLFALAAMKVHRVNASLTRREVGNSILKELEARLGLSPGILGANTD